jgi:small-conductance mechanosensitive channel
MTSRRCAKKHAPLPRAFGAARIVLALLAGLELPAFAADSGSRAIAGSGPAGEGAVVVFNRKITTLRASLYGVSGADRARRASLWLDELFERQGPGKVDVMHETIGNGLLVDGALAFVITPADTDALAQETLEQATQRAKATLERVVVAEREAHNKQRFFAALARTGVATLALLGVILVTLGVRNFIVVRLANLLKFGASQVEVAGQKVLSGTRWYGLSRWLVRSVSWLVLLLAGYRWTSYVLDQFPYTRVWGEGLNAFLVGVASQIGNGILTSLPDLLIAFVIFLLARGLLGLVRPFFDGIERGSFNLGWLDHDTARATRRLFGAAVWIFAVVMAYPYLPGAGSEAFKGMSVLVGLMVTLGGSSLFGQAASGLILMYSRTLKIGEYVRIGEYEGTVRELGSFTTKLRTGLGEDVTLPNTLVLTAVTRNYSRASTVGRFTLRTVVSIGYDAPWRQVEALLVQAAHRTPGVLADPEPAVFQTALSDFYVEYRLVCQATQKDPHDRALALHQLNANILDVFNEHGVQIMSPHYLGDPAKHKVVEKKDWYAAPARKPPGSAPEDTSE